MSASTDEPVVDQDARDYRDAQDDPDPPLSPHVGGNKGGEKKKPVEPRPKPRRIIDVTKEALVLMAEALEEIGDAYAVYGFSGQGAIMSSSITSNPLPSPSPRPLRAGSGD